MILSLTNSKGGVGKSTMSVHLAVWLMEIRAGICEIHQAQLRVSRLFLLRDGNDSGAQGPGQDRCQNRWSIWIGDFQVGESKAQTTRNCFSPVSPVRTGIHHSGYAWGTPVLSG